MYSAALLRGTSGIEVNPDVKDAVGTCMKIYSVRETIVRNKFSKSFTSQRVHVDTVP